MNFTIIQNNLILFFSRPQSHRAAHNTPVNTHHGPVPILHLSLLVIVSFLTNHSTHHSCRVVLRGKLPTYLARGGGGGAGGMVWYGESPLGQGKELGGGLLHTWQGGRKRLTLLRGTGMA